MNDTCTLKWPFPQPPFRVSFVESPSHNGRVHSFLFDAVKNAFIIHLQPIKWIDENGIFQSTPPPANIATEVPIEIDLHSLSARTLAHLPSHGVLEKGVRIESHGERYEWTVSVCNCQKQADLLILNQDHSGMSLYSIRERSRSR